jgi:hemerythrin-like domain-containing protein
MEKTISQIMSEEHKKLNELLNEFEKDLTDLEKFNKFKWNIEKHFNIEEKAVFEVYNRVREEDIPEIFDLIEEHKEILRLITDLEDDVKKEKIGDIENLRHVLERHRKFEEEDFYPELDKDLGEEEQQEIREKSKNLVE